MHIGSDLEFETVGSCVEDYRYAKLKCVEKRKLQRPTAKERKHEQRCVLKMSHENRPSFTLIP